MLSKELKEKLDKYENPEDMTLMMMWCTEKVKDENKELKKQLEEKKMLIKQCDLSISKVMDCYCERTDCSGRIKDSKQYDSLVQKVETQQQEFINYLEDVTKEVEKTIEMLSDTNSCRIQNLKYKGNTLKEILQKYKSIIGVSDESR